jgi:hypothetical protein
MCPVSKPVLTSNDDIGDPPPHAVARPRRHHPGLYRLNDCGYEKRVDGGDTFIFLVGSRRRQ